MRTLIRHINCLVGVQDPKQPLRKEALAQLPSIKDAFLLLEDDVILRYGVMNALDLSASDVDQVIDAKDRFVLPAWCDSHTHLVFAATREEEFVDKLKGATYAEIAAKGGGILNSARKVQACSEDELFQGALLRLKAAILLGTGAMEIKSGYGLQTEAEIKMLRVIKRLKEQTPIPIRSNFLGAHAFPVEYKDDREGYLRLLIEEMLPRIAAEQLADYIDVFCERGFFSPDETSLILAAAAAHGLRPKIHANQLSVSGGVEVGVRHDALSVDHLECMDDAAIDCLSAADTIGTLLPGCSLFLRAPYAPARALIDSGAAIALASDFNPGSAPSYNMNLVVSLACTQMRLLPEESVNAATINGAFAMELADRVGSIAAGKKANLIFTKPMSSLAYLPYSFGENVVERVMINGKFYL
ncbi:MAG: imidazolonepropionase [Bacteroidetes bacterium]|nr:imidazolonepropionase [Bacteroidota bacterium]